MYIVTEWRSGRTSEMKCCKCNVELVEKKTTFDYLGHEANYPLMRCPKCGQVYVPEELVKGKIADVEKLLEEK